MAKFKRVSAGIHEATHNGKIFRLTKANGKSTWEIDRYPGTCKTLAQAQAHLNFIVFVEDYLQYDIKAELLQKDNYPWSLQTPLGLLKISLWSDSVMCRFENVALAKQYIDRRAMNHYSGKWNHHHVIHYVQHAEYAFRRFIAEIERVMSFDCQESN